MQEQKKTFSQTPKGKSGGIDKTRILLHSQNMGPKTHRIPGGEKKATMRGPGRGAEVR